MQRWFLFVCILSCVWSKHTSRYIKQHKTNNIYTPTPKEVSQTAATPLEVPEPHTTPESNEELEEEASSNEEAACVNCGGKDRKIVSVNEDFNKLKVDPDLNIHVSAILERLKTFKQPIHPRIRLFHELLKVSMREYAQRTADSLYVPDKYNVQADSAKNSD